MLYYCKFILLLHNISHTITLKISLPAVGRFNLGKVPFYIQLEYSANVFKPNWFCVFCKELWKLSKSIDNRLFGNYDIIRICLTSEARNSGLPKSPWSISRLYCPVCVSHSLSPLDVIYRPSLSLSPISHLLRLVALTPLLFCFLLLTLIYFRLDSFNLSSHYLFMWSWTHNCGAISAIGCLRGGFSFQDVFSG